MQPGKPGVYVSYTPDGGIDQNRFISKEAMLARQRAVNPGTSVELTEDKMVFYGHCVANDLPTPRVIGALGDGDGKWPDSVNVATTDTEWRALCSDIEETHVVLKPVNGVHGQSVMLLHHANGVFTSHSGEQFDSDGLLAEMQQASYNDWILQQRLFSHQDIVDLSGTGNLQTARVITWIDQNGESQVLFAWPRAIGSEEAFDNFNFGMAGNFVATLDLDSFSIQCALGAAEDGHGLVEVEQHPTTGRSMPGFVVPHGPVLLETVKRAAEAFKPLRTIGWDVAITPEGVALIEGNVTWDPLPTLEDLSGIAELKPDE